MFFPVSAITYAAMLTLGLLSTPVSADCVKATTKLGSEAHYWGQPGRLTISQQAASSTAGFIFQESFDQGFNHYTVAEGTVRYEKVSAYAVRYHLKLQNYDSAVSRSVQLAWDIPGGETVVLPLTVGPEGSSELCLVMDVSFTHLLTTIQWIKLP